MIIRFALAFALCTTAAQAASIVHRGDRVILSGPIELGDELRFSPEVLQTLPRVKIIELNSLGGNPFPAIAMGRVIKSEGLATTVTAKGSCTSACALMWLAGSPRYAPPNATIAFHGVIDTRTGMPSSFGNARTGAYLDELGLSDAAIDALTTPFGPNNVQVLTPALAHQLGITIVEELPTPAVPPIRTARAMRAYWASQGFTVVNTMPLPHNVTEYLYCRPDHKPGETDGRCVDWADKSNSQ
jgi:hypothetical protein